MSKHDWKALQEEFLIAHETTAVKAKEWCESKGLNYSSARRYIKVTKAAAEVKEKVKTNPKVKMVKAQSTELVKNSGQKQFGNQHAVTHGAYRKYFTNEIGELAEATNLQDELVLSRANLHMVMKTIDDINEKLDTEKPPVEVAARLYNSLTHAQSALDRIILRIESLTKTISSLHLDLINTDKIIADTDKSIETAKALRIRAKKDKVQTELTELQVEKFRKELGGVSKLDDFIDDLTSGQDKVVG